MPSTHTILGMIAAGLTIALVDPSLRQMAAPGVVFRALAGKGIFTETGVIYRRNDPSPILALFELVGRGCEGHVRTPRSGAVQGAHGLAKSSGSSKTSAVFSAPPIAAGPDRRVVSREPSVVGGFGAQLLPLSTVDC